ncbi:MAG: sodium/solute symporter [Armatimonadota bacterium]|nr:sodium/solute symporter [Armatimonadota bacterium]
MTRRRKTTSEYFIADRKIPGWAVAFSLMATMISSVTFVAHPGAAFSRNMWPLLTVAALPVVFVFIGLVIVPFYRRVVRMSVYEYMDKRFGTGARVYTSAGFIIIRMWDLGFTLYTTAIAASVMSGWDIRYVLLGLAVYTTLYTMLGGIEGVIWTDVVQGFVLIGGGLLVLALIFVRAEGGAASILSEAYRAGKFGIGETEFSFRSMYREMPTAWILFLAGGIAMARNYVTEQNMVQRYLVARTDREAKRGAFAGALICIPIWLLFMFIGACLYGFYRSPGVQLPADVVGRPDNILPYFVVTQMPAGLVGVILAAILAAAQSSISADLNSVSTVATNDYFARLFPKSSDRARLRFGRFAVLLGGAVCASIAMLLTIGRSRAAMEIGVTLGGILAGGVLGLFALAFFTRRGNRLGANVGIASCLLFTTWATVTGPLRIDLGINFGMNPIMLGLFTQVILFAVGYAISVVWPVVGKEDVTGLTVWSMRSAD